MFTPSSGGNVGMAHKMSIMEGKSTTDRTDGKFRKGITS